MCSDTDYSGVNRAAEATARISQDALDFYRDNYENQAPAREAAAARANAVSEAQLSSMNQNMRLARDYADYQSNTFRPMERALIDEANNYDTNARRDQAAGAAMADVSQQAASARDIQQRNLTRMGVNPNDGRFAAMSNQTTMQEALGKAAAGAQARRQTEIQGYARRADAVNLGRGLASNQATSSGIALNAGNASANSAQMPLGQNQAATQMMGQGFNSASQGQSQSGNLFGMAANGMAQENQQDTATLATVGSIAGVMI